MSSKHTSVKCGKQQGACVGLLCDRCAGKCVLCEAFTDPLQPAFVCDECGDTLADSVCVLCGGRRNNNNKNKKEEEDNEARFCRECVALLKHCDGCPRNIAVGGSAAAGPASKQPQRGRR